MKKLFAAALVAGTLLGTAAPVLAQEEKGGIGPCLASYYIGPRAGYQMNDGVSIRTLEIIEIFFAPLRLYDGYLAWDGKGWDEIVKEENLK
jgi:hypothetical protein